MVSFRGQKKLGPRPDRSPLRVLFLNFRRASPPLSYAESSRPRMQKLVQAIDQQLTLLGIFREYCSEIFPKKKDRIDKHSRLHNNDKGKYGFQAIIHPSFIRRLSQE